MGYGKIQLKTPLFGKAFESFLYQELRAYCDYNHIKDLHYWRTQNRDEVDFILNQSIAIEVKSSPQIGPKDLKSLIRLKEEGICKKYFLIYTGTTTRRFDIDPDIEVIPYPEFLDRLWKQKIL
jgi:predicted AAA+ superfamily ATPase